MKRVVALVLFTCIHSCLVAQDWAKATAPPPSEKLKVGDRIPFSELHNMINYPAKTLKLNDHKPKLIILDFWATTCSSCVAGWPKTLELKKRFGDDLQLILVNAFERENFIRTFLKTRKKLTGVEMTLPISLRDSTIWKYFPERGVPRYVWLTPDGVVNSITDGFQFTTDNIQKWMTFGPFEMPQIVDNWFRVDYNKPIFIDGNGGPNHADDIIWTSSLSKGQRDISGSAEIFYKPELGYGITLTGTSIFNIYAHAYNNRMGSDDFTAGRFFYELPSSRMALEVKDTTKYYRHPEYADNSYNYQILSGKPASGEQLQNMMKEDLKRYFGLEVTWEKRNKMCIVWSMFDSTLAKQQKTSLAKDVFIGETEVSLDSVTVRNSILFMEIGASKYFPSPYPIVDETNYKGLLVGIRYEGNAFDLKQFGKDMSRYGIRIKLEPREVDVLVLREPASN
jgi:thiol-disulfide isomerase/thioredoxin